MRRWATVAAAVPLGLVAIGCGDGGDEPQRYTSPEELAEALECDDFAEGDELSPGEEDPRAAYGLCRLDDRGLVLQVFDTRNDAERFRELGDQAMCDLPEGTEVYYVSGERWAVTLQVFSDQELAEDVHERLPDSELVTPRCPG